MDIKYSKYKSEWDYSYAYGFYPTIELFKHRSEQVLEVIFHSNSIQLEQTQTIKQLCIQNSVPYSTDDQKIFKITPNDNSYCIAIFKKYKTVLSNETNHISLVDLHHTNNIGTILRTMHGYDFFDLALIDKNLDFFNPKLIRASMGSFFYLNIEMFSSLEEYTSKFTNQIYTFTIDSDNKLSDLVPKKPYTFVFGNETLGLSDNQEKLGINITIEQSTSINSLNVAISSGIAMHHAYLIAQNQASQSRS